jgi:hypothetical protein
MHVGDKKAHSDWSDQFRFPSQCQNGIETTKDSDQK